MNKLFIDIGLMTFIEKNRNIIMNHKYGWVNLDNDGRIISWEQIGNPLFDSLAKYVTKKIIENNSHI